MRHIVIAVLTILIFCEKFAPISSSYGDRSFVYINCLNRCLHENCTNDGETFKMAAAQQQDIWCRLVRWSCREECCYDCMWRTVHKFRISGESTPKFHGRWPFTRILGMQEPASVFASMLNFAANLHMYKKIRREFPLAQPQLPIVTFWHAFAFVCMNAWLWSTVFHLKDNPFTEFMDYACALSMVMGLFVAAIVRVFHKRTKLAMCILAVPLFYFVTHVRYLYTGFIDYDYNIRLNVFFGAAGSVIWLGVSWRQYSRGRGYAWRMLAFTALSGAALGLELFDFPPKYNVLDAHALWHFATAPLPMLFYKYVIDDLRYLQSIEPQKFAFKLT